MAEALVLVLDWAHCLDDLWLAGSLLAGGRIPRLTQQQFLLKGAGTLRTGDEIQRYPGKRVVVHAWLDGRRVVAKFYLGRARQWWEWYRGLRGARAFLQAGVPAPAVRHAGFVPEIPAWITVLDHVATDQPWPPDGDAISQEDHRLLIEALAEHHRHGIEQNDLNSKNFLPQAGRLWSIDGDRAHRRPGPLKAARSRANLIRFYGGKTGIDDAMIRDGYRHYCAQRGWRCFPEDERRLLAEIRLARRATAERVAGRAKRGWKFYRASSRKNIRGIVDSRAFQVKAEEALGKLLGQAQQLRSQREICVGDSRLHVQPLPQHRPEHGASTPLQSGRPLRTWTKAVLLRRLHLPVPRPVGIVEERLGLGRHRGALLLENQGPLEPLAGFIDTAPADRRRELQHELAELLWALYHCRLSHRRFGYQALGLDDDRLVLTDLEGLRRYPRWLPGFDIIWRRDMGEFLHALQQLPGSEQIQFPPRGALRG